MCCFFNVPQILVVLSPCLNVPRAFRRSKQAQAKPCSKIDIEYLSRCLQDHYMRKSSALPVIPPHVPKWDGTGKTSGIKRQREEDDDNNDGYGDTKRVCHSHDEVGSRVSRPKL